MKDLQLAGGDLVLGARGFGTVDGTAYLRQRIALAMGEPYGDDQYNPQWGSVLPSFVGLPITADTPVLVSSEVARVLQMLIASQQAQVTRSALNGTRSQLNAGDVIASVQSISSSTGPNPDAVQVAIVLTTQAGQQVAISRTVTSG